MKKQTKITPTCLSSFAHENTLSFPSDSWSILFTRRSWMPSILGSSSNVPNSICTSPHDARGDQPKRMATSHTSQGPWACNWEGPWLSSKGCTSCLRSMTPLRLLKHATFSLQLDAVHLRKLIQRPKFHSRLTSWCKGRLTKVVIRRATSHTSQGPWACYWEGPWLSSKGRTSCLISINLTWSAM
jgi:hypothetical protein